MIWIISIQSINESDLFFLSPISELTHVVKEDHA